MNSSAIPKAQNEYRSPLKMIPNAITTANLLCGFYAIICAMNGQIVQAAWFIIIAGLFDLVDGRIARMLNATTEFGGYFDTLSDQMSFGVAPAVLFYQAGLRNLPSVGWLVTFLYALSVSFRLARFSVTTIVGEKGFFRGLSSPVSACTAATLILFLSTQNFQEETGMIMLTVSSVILAVLMASRMRFPSFKNTKWRSPAGATIAGIGIVGLAVCLVHPMIYLFPALSIFILGTLLWNLTGLIAVRTNQESLSKK